MEHKTCAYHIADFKTPPSCFPPQHQNRQPGREYIMEPPTGIRVRSRL